ncbi:MAG: galactokinase, partial [Spirochaetaceae bacterium]|nr:galactokinase [Spirochaetaceae bacterium]
PNEENVVQIYSEGFPDLFKVSLHELDQNAKSIDPTTSLIRGVISIFKSRGKKIGGFNAYITSDVLVGSGLSSSASIEVLLGKIISLLFNKDSVDSVELAIIGQEAENIFLGKPCGLMDQLACAYGGIVAIDFENPSKPDITALDYSFNNNGYQLLVIDTGGDHADLTDDYAAIPMEMKNVAEFFGEKNLRDLKREDFFREIPELTRTLGDRAVLRALHFFNEDERVVFMVDHLQQNRIEKYLDTVQKSGDSSYKYLQNVFTSKHVSAQKISLAIALTECFPDFKGAVRVHGGGFAGTIQVYLKLEVCKAYTDYMKHFFGPQSVTPLKIREKGAVTIL